jgi:hypothetical protein
MMAKRFFLVEKRDGRLQRLRATKLARSIFSSLRAAGVAAEPGQSAELASAVLRELCGGGPPRTVPSRALAAAVERALERAGLAAGASAYAAVARERARRRARWASLPDLLPPRPAAARPRWRAEPPPQTGERGERS